MPKIYVEGQGWIEEREALGSPSAPSGFPTLTGVETRQDLLQGTPPPNDPNYRPVGKLLESAPQVLGALAQFHPALRAGRAGWMAAAAVPSIADMVSQLLQGVPASELDPVRTGAQAAIGTSARGVRGGVEVAGEYGRGNVTGIATMGGPATRTIQGVKIKPEPFSPAMLRSLTDTAIAERPPLSEEGVKVLGQRWLSLQNQILDRYPQATTVEEAFQLARRAKDPLVARMESIAKLEPVLERSVSTAMRQKAGPARFLAGSGVGGMVGRTLGAGAGAGAAGSWAGLDPASATALGLGTGAAVGAMEASPKLKMAAGVKLARLGKAGPLLGLITQLLAAAGIGASDAMAPAPQEPQR